MAALNFPAAPSDGDKWVDPSGQPWVYETSTNSWTAHGTAVNGMVYKGGIDITATPPTGATGGWAYTATTSGTPNAGFTGLSGPIAAGTQLIFDGTNWQQQGASNWIRGGTILFPAIDGDSLTLHDTGGIPAVQLDPGTSGSPLVRDSNGNLGVGIAAPPLYNANLRTVSFNGTNGVVHDYAVGGTRTGSIITQAAGMQISTQTATPIIFTTDEGGAGGEAARIDKDGKVGVGTQAPAYLLDCKGTGANNVARFLTGSSSSSEVAQFGRSDQAVNLSIDYDGAGAMGIGTTTSHPFNLKTGAVTRATIDSAGRLLVGTATATSNRFLQIQGNADSATGAGSAFFRRDLAPGSVVVNDTLGFADYGYSDGGVVARIEAKAGGAGTAGSSYPGQLTFSTTPSGSATPVERMRIKENGQVLIACTSSPSSTVKGVGWTDNSGTGYFYSSAVSLTGTSTHVQLINPNGVVGSITTNASATAYNTSSDYRLKENVTAVTDGITRLQQLKPCRFNFIADPSKTVDGFIAHEAQEVIPECVTGTKDEVDADGKPVYQGIDQSKLVPLLTAALQEAVARIEDLEAKVTALEGGSPMKDDSPRSKSRP